MCRSGMRTASARDRLLANTTRPTFVLKGGIDAWSAAGLPTITDTKAPIEIMRQVQIAAGLLILAGVALGFLVARSEEHTSELQSLMRISYAVFCMNKKTETDNRDN